MTTIAVISAGSMGSAVGRVLADRGANVLTLLDGRSAATEARARAAEMTAATPDRIAEADFILSIVPPGSARALAERLAPAIAAAAPKPVYVECNAIDPGTVAAIAAVLRPAGAAFVDGGIIGGPPKPDADGPTFYLSGEDAPRAMALAEYGLKLRLLDGGIGAASALKMSYAGITKGLTAIGAMMMLAAERSGVASALHRELGESQPALLSWFRRQVPGMFPRAYRWVAEMEEIAAFAGEDAAARAMYEGAARFYERMAADVARRGPEMTALDAFCKR